MNIKSNNVKLEEILNYSQPTDFLVKKITNEGNIPILTANKSFILGYTKNSENIFNDLPCLIFDDFTCDLKYVNFPFKLKSSAIKILTLKNKNYDLKYFYEKLKLIKKENFEHKRNWISDYKNRKIKLIDINKQKLIGDFFTKIDQIIEIIKQKNNFFIELKKYLLNNIFNLSKNYDYTILKNISLKIKAGGTPNTLIKNYYNGDINFVRINDLVKNNKYLKNTKLKITKLGLNNSNAWIIPKNNILYSIYGSIGNVAINKINVSTSQGILGIILNKEKIDKNFIYYYLFFYKNFISSKANKSVFLNLNLKNIEIIRIPIININKQKLIGDSFTKMDQIIEKNRSLINFIQEYKNYYLKEIFI